MLVANEIFLHHKDSIETSGKRCLPELNLNIFFTYPDL